MLGGGRLRWPLRRVLVSGPSMSPTLRHGDAVLIRSTGRIRPGDVVVARFAGTPDRLVVKRAIRRGASGWWLEGDNPYGSDDSRRYGEADVLGRVLVRYWPRPGRLPPRNSS